MVFDARRAIWGILVTLHKNQKPWFSMSSNHNQNWTISTSLKRVYSNMIRPQNYKLFKNRKFLKFQVSKSHACAKYYMSHMHMRCLLLPFWSLLLPMHVTLNRASLSVTLTNYGKWTCLISNIGTKKLYLQKCWFSHLAYPISNIGTNMNIAYGDLICTLSKLLFQKRFAFGDLSHNAKALSS